MKKTILSIAICSLFLSCNEISKHGNKKENDPYTIEVEARGNFGDNNITVWLFKGTDLIYKETLDKSPTQSQIDSAIYRCIKRKQEFILLSKNNKTIK